jgi:guanylate kinase
MSKTRREGWVASNDSLSDRADEIIAELRGRRHGLVLVLSGPSGVGKDTVLEVMRRSHDDLYFTVTATTRPQRPGEMDHVHYIFLSQPEFAAMLAQGEFLEHAEVYGNHYGVPKDQVRKALDRSQDVLIKVDVQGAATIKELLPEAIFIFLAPPSMDELGERLRNRKTEDYDELVNRMRTAEREMHSIVIFDYVVVNESDQVERTVSTIDAIITAERCRVRPRTISL